MFINLVDDFEMGGAEEPRHFIVSEVQNVRDKTRDLAQSQQHNTKSHKTNGVEVEVELYTYTYIHMVGNMTHISLSTVKYWFNILQIYLHNGNAAHLLHSLG